MAILSQAAPGETSLVSLWVLIVYLGFLLGLGVISGRLFRGTSKDYFVASHSIGPFMLFMSIFGTTMTGFALVGSTGKAFGLGIGVYGLMASWSGLIHSAVFFIIGIRLWAFGKRLGFVTQIQFFRERFDSKKLGYLLFPILVMLVIPYLLVGVISAMKVVQPITAGMFPETFPHASKALSGGIPPWLSGLVICGVVLFYVFKGGVRSAAFAHTFQTMVFMVTGLIAFLMIANSDKLGGSITSATDYVVENAPEKLTRGNLGQLHFLSYLFIPLSVAMFPHLFQHWLTAKSAGTFKLTVIAHPICIAIVWVPCVLIGVWAAGLHADGVLKMPLLPDGSPAENTALAMMVKQLVSSELLSGLLMAGILAAIMSSLDSQFMCLGTMFTNDVVVSMAGPNRFSDRQLVSISRWFIVGIVVVSYGLALALQKSSVFDLGIWCFTGFASLFPLVFAALYWKRVTKAGAFASILTTLGVWLYFFYQDIILEVGGKSEYLVAEMMPVTFILLASTVSLVAVSLATRPPAASTVDRFFPTAE